jgi:cysteinyl-tRNA synthetase
LNTARALAAIFDMVREANAAADAGQVKRDDVPLLLGTIGKFDGIFPVLTDDDAPKMHKALEWAKSEGIAIPKELAHLAGTNDGLPDAEVERLIGERNAAKKARDFKRSDAIRDELAAQGVVLEDTKDGVRWKRK